jgi:hypothetical protein
VVADSHYFDDSSIRIRIQVKSWVSARIKKAG